jgi:3-deoxy-D-manno-octulosonic-acid transferase
MSHKSITAVLPLILLLVANTVVADSQPGRSIGVETRSWLELQSGGAAASKNHQIVSGPVADRIYQRYLKSFEHPIPEFYKSNQSGNMGGGGGSSK